jgi:hypothetical protein
MYLRVSRMSRIFFWKIILFILSICLDITQWRCTSTRSCCWTTICL